MEKEAVLAQVVSKTAFLKGVEYDQYYQRGPLKLGASIFT